jgi:hypothetical protein
MLLYHRNFTIPEVLTDCNNNVHHALTNVESNPAPPALSFQVLQDKAVLTVNGQQQYFQQLTQVFAKEQLLR